MNALERVIRRVDEAQQQRTVPAFLFGVIKKFGDDNAGALTVQFAYALFVTVFPLLLLLVTILGIVLADDPADRHRVLGTAFGQFPLIGQQLAQNVHAIKRSSAFGLVVGIVGLIYGSTGLAQVGLFSMEQIWNIPSAVRPNFLSRLSRSLLFLLTLAVGLILTTALAGFGTFGRHNLWLGIAGEILAACVNVGLYLAAFRILTPKQVGTRALLPGSVVGGVAWTILQAVGGYVVGHDLKGASAVYGTFGLVLGLLAWLYLGAELTLYAAETNAVIFRRLWPRAMMQPPLTEADQESLALQALQNQRRLDQVVTTSFGTAPMTEAEYRARGYEVDDSSSGIERTTHPDAEHPEESPSSTPGRSRPRSS